MTSGIRYLKTDLTVPRGSFATAQVLHCISIEDPDLWSSLQWQSLQSQKNRTPSRRVSVVPRLIYASIASTTFYGFDSIGKSLS